MVIGEAGGAAPASLCSVLCAVEARASGAAETAPPAGRGSTAGAATERGGNLEGVGASGACYRRDYEAASRGAA